MKVDVENTPFLVDKLHIRVLPCIMAFVNGISKDKLIGFESFGNSDSFTTAALEWRLGQTGMYGHADTRRDCTATESPPAYPGLRRGLVGRSRYL